MRPRFSLLWLAAAAGLAVPAAAQPTVVPTVECVEDAGDGTYRAYFGYDTHGGVTARIPLGAGNQIQGGRASGAPPVAFEAGAHRYAFAATFSDHLTWSLQSGGTTRTVRADRRHASFGACQPPADAEPVSPGALTLRGISPAGFHPVGANALYVDVEQAAFAREASRTLAVVNGVYLTPSEVTSSSVRLDVTLGAGRNEVAFYGVDADGLGLSARYVLWAGARAQTVRVSDEAGAPLDGARVRLALVDDPDVAAEGLTRGGSVTFENVPPRLLVASAESAPDAFGMTGALGDGQTVDVVATGFGAPSAAVGHDLARGIDGWRAPAGSVALVPHEDSVGPRDAFLEDGAARRSGLAGDDDVDLQLTAAGEGVQRASRTFRVAPGTRSVTVRYRFVTAEAASGYLGSEYNDGFGVSIRSQAGGGRAWEQSSVTGLGRAAFGADGSTAWRELELPVSGGDVVQVDLVVANVGDGTHPSRLVVDRIEQGALAISEVTLRDNTLYQGALQACYGATLLGPLEYFSVGVTEFWGGNTLVWGDLAVTGPPEDALTDVRLEAVVGGRVLSSGTLSEAARGDLVTSFGSDGIVSTSQAATTPLFAVPGSRYRATDEPVTLRLRATAASGATATRRVGTFPTLVYYPGDNRYGSALHDPEQGGDAWARWSALQWALDVSADPLSSAFLFNDFANMNGGKFPIHCTHRTGEIVDVTYVGLPSKSAEAAQYLIDVLNGPHGARVERVQTTYALGDSFGQVIADAGTLADGRRALDVVGILSGHPTHMHVTLFPDGGQAGGGGARLAGAALSGQAWTERGARVEPVAGPALAGATSALAVQVAPNPVVGGRLAFEVRGSGDEVRAVVYDVVGRVVARGTFPASGGGTASGSLDLGDLAAGLYVLRVDAGGQVVTTPFVVAR